MRKILVEFPEQDALEEINYGERIIKVKKYISIENQELLIASYLETFFGNNEDVSSSGRFSAEILWDIILLDIMTNIKVDSNKIDMDDVYSSGILELIKPKISNYADVKRKRDMMLGDVIRERDSLSGILDGLISKIENLDFDKLDNLKGAIAEVQELAKNSPISSLMDEGRDS